MKKIIYSILFASLISFVNSIYAQEYIRSTTVIDTPTAYTISRGVYQVSILGYDNGGVEIKTFIGLHDNLYLGISLDTQNAIGKDKTEPNVPGVVAKLKFTDGWESFPISFAIGYDSFYIGEQGKTSVSNEISTEQGEDPYYSENKLNRMIYGPYFVVTKPIYLLDDEQHIHFGIRVPTQPNYVPEDASYFIGLDIPLSQYFILKAEGERIYYDFSRGREWIFNTGIRYNYLNQLGLEVDFLFQKDERVNRIIRIEYTNTF